MNAVREDMAVVEVTEEDAVREVMAVVEVTEEDAEDVATSDGRSRNKNT